MGYRLHALPLRYEGRTDVAYVPKGMAISEVRPMQDLLCALVSEGHGLTAISKRPGMPSLPTIYTMLRADDVFAKCFARAKEEQAETFANELAEIADSAQGMDNAGVQAARLRVDARKWVASKLLPKRYGDRLDVTHAGGISIASASLALRTVDPITFDEEGNEIGADDAMSIERATVSEEGECVPTTASPMPSKHLLTGPIVRSEHTPTPGAPAPGTGTPSAVTASDTPQAQIPKIPPLSQHTSVEPSTLSDLL